jgi:prevent-host-death family protein
MGRYSVAEAKNNLAKLIDRALAGEEVTITRRGKPTVDIVSRKARGAPLDPVWFDKHRVKPKAGSDFNAAELIRQMRDEGY